jgi:Domain of unknown function (DUF3943)
MIRFCTLFILLNVFSFANAAEILNCFPDTTVSVLVQADSLKTENKKLSVKTKRKTLLQKFPPYIDEQTQKFILRNQHAPFGQKVLRGAGLVVSAHALTVGLLFVIPERTSNWDRSALGDFGGHFIEAFQKPPVIDGDKWYINYLGHPYQGAYYYNAYRSQGAKFWQASLFCIGHSMMWEYLVESGFERPSIQDMIVTPIAGSLLGELFHFATVRMSRNGFKWYEAAFVSVFNPMYAINNGFKSARYNK